jgi:hypothetical protein
MLRRMHKSVARMVGIRVETWQVLCTVIVIGID